MPHRSLIGTLATIAGLSLACGGAEDDVWTTELELLPYRACSRDASYPELYILSVGDDGEPFEHQHLGGVQPRWGRTIRVQLEHRRNEYWGHTSSVVTEVLSEEETPGLSFRMRRCGPTFLGDDGRSLIDGTRFRCRPEACRQLKARTGERARYDLLFRFGKNVDDPLVLVGVEDATCKRDWDCEGSGLECHDHTCRPKR